MSENEIRKLELHNATNNLRNTNDVDPLGHERGLPHGSRFRPRRRAGGGKDSERGGRREEEIVERAGGFDFGRLERSSRASGPDDISFESRPILDSSFRLVSLPLKTLTREFPLLRFLYLILSQSGRVLRTH
jgi:hypothetical protein